MPDYLKEEVQALREAVSRLMDERFIRQGIGPLGPGRVLGTQVPLSGASGRSQQNFFTTGYDAINGVTTLPVTLDFSVLDGPDVLTM
jgi:hypothetical protein